jgi:tetratricopeptide (TPR) repeat protein
MSSLQKDNPPKLCQFTIMEVTKLVDAGGQVLGLRETVLGKEHPSTLTSVDNLALALRPQGKYEEAEEMHRQALGLNEPVLGKEHPDTLMSTSNLANVLSDQVRYEQAEEIHRQALFPCR